MKITCITLFILFLSTMSCNKNNEIVEPSQPTETIKGTIELPIKGNAENILIIAGDQEVIVSNKNGRNIQENISGTFSIKASTEKTQLIFALDKKTLEPLAFQVYNPKLQEQLRITIKSTVDGILKQHPLLQTNDPVYDLEFNNLLESVGEVNALYLEIENLYKTFNPTSGFATIAEIIPLIGFTKIPFIWEKLEQKFFSKWNISINNYLDAKLDPHTVSSNNKLMVFQIVNPLSRYISYSVKKGKYINNTDEHVEDSFSNMEFVGPPVYETKVGDFGPNAYYTGNWFWSIFTGKTFTTLTEKSSTRNINIEGYDYSDVYLYSLGRKGDEKIHPQDLELYIYTFAVNSLDLGLSAFEFISQLNFKKELSQTLKGRGRNAKEPLKRLLIEYTKFITKKQLLNNVIPKQEDFWDEKNFKISKFLNESIKLTAEFLTENELNRKLLFDYIESEVGKQVLDKSLKATGKFAPVMLKLYIAWTLFKGSVDAIDKFDGFYSGNMIQKFSRVINPNSVTQNTQLKLSKTDIIPYELVYIEGNGFTPNKLLDYQSFTIKMGNETPRSGYEIINETTTDANGNFKTWIRLPNPFSNNLRPFSVNSPLKTTILLNDGKKQSEITCNLLKKPFSYFYSHDYEPISFTKDGYPIVPAVGDFSVGIVLNHNDYGEVYPLKVTFPTSNEQTLTISQYSDLISFFGNPKTLLKSGKQVVKIENLKTNDILTEYIFVKEPSSTTIELSSNKIKNGDKILCKLYNFSTDYNECRYKVSFKGPSIIGDHNTTKRPFGLLDTGTDSFEIKKGSNVNLFQYNDLQIGTYEITITDIKTNLEFKTTFEVVQ